jgi:putative ABC transport system permease protein
LTLTPGASEGDVIAAVDRALDRYGGLGAMPRSLQSSHWFLNNELTQLQSFGTIIPVIFLAVAAFLMNVVLSRIVTVQREQIAALKALGYSNGQIGLHYYQWSLIISLTGVAIGMAAGAWLASSLVSIYNDFFRFPVLEFEIAPRIVLSATLVSVLAGLLGARGAVLRAVRLPPAEAMRPQAPARYRVTLVERLLLGSRVAPATRMIVRNLSRRPLRSALSVVGIAFGAAMVIEGMFFLDSMTFAMHVQFNVSQRQDLTVSFVGPASAGALHELERLEGVMSVEPTRSVPVRLSLGHRSRQAAITGLVDSPQLNRVIDRELNPVTLTPDGILLSTKMAEILGAAEGDLLTVGVLEGARPTREVVVSEVVEEFMGTSVYMEINALRRLVREGPLLSGAFLQVDALYLDTLYDRLRELPAVAAVAPKDAAIQAFRDSVQENMATIIQYLQEDVEDIRMCFFNFIK